MKAGRTLLCGETAVCRACLCVLGRFSLSAELLRRCDAGSNTNRCAVVHGSRFIARMFSLQGCFVVFVSCLVLLFGDVLLDVSSKIRMARTRHVEHVAKGEHVARGRHAHGRPVRRSVDPSAVDYNRLSGTLRLLLCCVARPAADISALVLASA